MPTIEVSDETYDKIKDQLGESDQVLDMEQLEDLTGNTVTLWCARYIYHGKVKRVGSTFITLENAGIVYETGAFDKKDWETIQTLPHDWYITIASIESYGLLK